MKYRFILFFAALAMLVPAVPAQAETDSDERRRPSASRSRSGKSRGAFRGARSSRGRSSKVKRSSARKKSSSRKKSKASRARPSSRSKPSAWKSTRSSRARSKPTAATRPRSTVNRPKARSMARSKARPTTRSKARPTTRSNRDARSRSKALPSTRSQSPRSKALPASREDDRSRSKARPSSRNLDRSTPSRSVGDRDLKQSPRGRVGDQPHRTAANRPQARRGGDHGRKAVWGQNGSSYGGKKGSKKGSAWYNKHHGKKKPLAKYHHHHGKHYPKHYRPGHGWYHHHHGRYYPVRRHAHWGWWYHHYRPAPVWGWWYPVILPWHRYYYVYHGPNPWWLGYPVIVYEETVIVAEPEMEEEIIEWYEVPDESAWEDYSEYDSADATWDTGYSEWVEVEDREAFAEGDDGWEIVEEEEGWYDPETGQVYDQLPADAVEAELTPEETVPERIADGAGFFSDSMESQIVDLINEERTAQGLQPVAEDPRLTNAARQHSREMNDLEYFSHQSPNEEFGTLTRRLGKAGMKRYGWAGENIAMSTSPTAEDFVKMWMESPGHRENILRAQFKYTGIGVYGDGETFYATQVFSSQH